MIRFSTVYLLAFLFTATPALATDNKDGYFSSAWDNITTYFSNDGKDKHKNSKTNGNMDELDGIAEGTTSKTKANVVAAKQSVSVTAIDVTPPIISIQQPAIIIEAIAPQMAVNLGLVTAIDLIDGVIAPISNAPLTFPLGTTTITYTAIDASGNMATSTQAVTVIDTTPPVITVPIVITTNSPTGQPVTVNIGTAIATDVVDGAIVPTNNAPVLFPIGTKTVTWTATDTSGNTAKANQLVSVIAIDVTPPVIVLPAGVTLASKRGQPIAVKIGVAVATDASNPVTITNDAPYLFPIGITTVTWTAIDSSGNVATGHQFITVYDPFLLAPLPVDPGAAGLVSLEGIDSDNDGVRDDLQRWIVLTYPNSVKTRMALTQEVMLDQQFILNADDPEASLRIANFMMNSEACLAYVQPINFYDISSEFQAMVLNTYARSKAWLRVDRHLSGSMFKGPHNNKDGCNFNPDIMPN